MTLEELEKRVAALEAFEAYVRQRPASVKQTIGQRVKHTIHAGKATLKRGINRIAKKLVEVTSA